MHWLSSPKVRLGLVVNGLYLLSLFTPSAPPPNARVRTYAPTYERTYERETQRLRSKTMAPVYTSLPPQTGTLKAETHYWKASDQLDVYLTRELLLVRRYDHALVLSPSFSTRVLSPTQPRAVLLHFSSFSHEQLYDRDSSFVIRADGAELWRYGWRGPGDETPPGAKVLYWAGLDSNGQVVETLGHEIPSDIFVQLTRARQVTFELGPDNVELTPEQLDALRDMRRFLPHIPPATPGVVNVPYSREKSNY